MADSNIDDSAGACAPAACRPTPRFAAAGRKAELFNVVKGISSFDALDNASMFLDLAIYIGGEPDGLHNTTRWAVVHFMEMAKALVDAAVDGVGTEMAASKAAGGANHG